jgi:hypothetical protein
MKIYYKNQDGIITDITPVSYYSYNSSSKRNADSFDPFVLLIQTVALYTIFPMLRLVKRTQTIS